MPRNQFGDRLGEHGARIHGTVDNLTHYRIDVLKERIERTFKIKPCSAGMILRRAVADLFEKSEQWKDIAPDERERRLLEEARKARPAPDSAVAAYDQDSADLMKEARSSGVRPAESGR
jgi:hypothetical protein